MKETTIRGSRLRTPGWRDPKLLIGIVLVALAVTGVVGLVQSSDQRQGYWTAQRDLQPGATVTAEDFTVVRANLSDIEGQYWSSEEQLPDEFYVSATMMQGELLARRQLTASDPHGRQQVGLQVSANMPASIRSGTRVDVWVSNPDEAGRGYSAPERIIENAEVADINKDTSAFASSDTNTVYLMLEPGSVREVLGAQVNDAKISLVPTIAQD